MRFYTKNGYLHLLQLRVNGLECVRRHLLRDGRLHRLHRFILGSVGLPTPLVLHRRCRLVGEGPCRQSHPACGSCGCRRVLLHRCLGLRHLHRLVLHLLRLLPLASIEVVGNYS